MKQIICMLLAGVMFQSTPQAVVDDLLSTDRRFSSAAAATDVTSALSAMFADEVVMPTPAAAFAGGKAAAIEALKSNPDNATSRVEWSPIRGGVSADGLHGFTFGYMTLTRADKSRVPLKYLTYWIKGPAGWRAVVYKRGRSGEAPPSREMMPPALPLRLVAPSTDAAATARFRDSLDRAERAFSDEAQQIGVGPAFAKHGSADAVNMGPPAGSSFVVGAEAIGRGIGGGGPATGAEITWAPNHVIVASSGDVGVTLGMIRRKTPPKEGPAEVPFITVWRRAGPADPWRYVAE